MVMNATKKTTKHQFRFFRYLYTSFCIAFAGFWMIKHALQYFKNEDVSSLSFESFGEATGHGYPTYSICISDVDKKTDQVVEKKLLDPRYHPSKIVIDFHSKDVNGNELNTWTTSEYNLYAGPSRRQRVQNLSSLIGKSEFPFFIGYQDHRTICFTKKSKLSPSSKMRYDSFVLNMNKFECINKEGIPNIPKEFRNCFPNGFKQGMCERSFIFSNSSCNNTQNINSENIVNKGNSGANQISEVNAIVIEEEGNGAMQDFKDNNSPQLSTGRNSRNGNRNANNRMRRRARPSRYEGLNSSAICYLKTQNKVFGKEWVMGSFVARVYIHDPGYLLQGINQEQAEYDIKNIKHEETNKIISTRIQQVTRLRKRPDAQVECDPSTENDDKMYMTFLMNHVNCIPSYWRSIVEDGKNFVNCTDEKLKLIHSYIMDRENIPFLYKPSCASTIITAITEKMKMENFCQYTEDFWKFRVFYPQNIFTQIISTREVPAEGLVSGIGGFIGMCLGISLMQLPDLLFSKYFK